MSDDVPKPVIAYARGDFDKPIRSWTALRRLDVVLGIWLLLINGAVLFNTVQDMRYPPVPDPTETVDEVPRVVAPWQQWTAIVDAVLSITLVFVLFVAVARMVQPNKDQQAIRLHVFYAVSKLILVIALSFLWSWSVEKGRLDGDAFGGLFTAGVIHPLLILALLRQIRLEIRKREGLA